jgi:hypothetical protein
MPVSKDVAISQSAVWPPCNSANTLKPELPKHASQVPVLQRFGQPIPPRLSLASHRRADSSTSGQLCLLRGLHGAPRSRRALDLTCHGGNVSSRGALYSQHPYCGFIPYGPRRSTAAQMGRWEAMASTAPVCVLGRRGATPRRAVLWRPRSGARTRAYARLPERR